MRIISTTDSENIHRKRFWALNLKMVICYKHLFATTLLDSVVNTYYNHFETPTFPPLPQPPIHTPLRWNSEWMLLQPHPIPPGPRATEWVKYIRNTSSSSSSLFLSQDVEMDLYHSFSSSLLPHIDLGRSIRNILSASHFLSVSQN